VCFFGGGGGGDRRKGDLGEKRGDLLPLPNPLSSLRLRVIII